MNKILHKVGIIGFGAWGTALASVLAVNAVNVMCYTARQEVVSDFNVSRRNQRHFSGVTLANNIVASSNFANYLDSEFLCLVIPAQQIRGFMSEVVRQYGSTLPPIVICAKGLENESHKVVSQILEEIGITSPLAVLSGPNFASEIIQAKPASTTIACCDDVLAEKLLQGFATSYFTPQLSSDLVGVQVCGAFKNVIAIAAGIVRGLELGDNAYAALLTRGVEEMRILIHAMGGAESTINSFAGIGDLVLTCGSLTSRNTNFGYNIGRSMDRSLSTTVEGFYSTKAFQELADSLSLRLEILDSVYRILYKRADPKIIML
jgi:glycerol-3-phosphate dehydrogenase (NAD(P)+)